MFTTNDIELSIFKEVPDNIKLNILYSLIQDNTDEVGELDSIDSLSKLISMSAVNFYVLEGDNIIVFVI